MFANMEDKDRIFDGGSNFFALDELYMPPRMENFTLDKETFTKVLLGARLLL